MHDAVRRPGFPFGTAPRQDYDRTAGAATKRLEKAMVLRLPRQNSSSWPAGCLVEIDDGGDIITP